MDVVVLRHARTAVVVVVVILPVAVAMTVLIRTQLKLVGE
jgi:hypothetical protein